MEYYYDFKEEKNFELLDTRGVCFEDIIALINEGKVLDIVPHPNKVKHPNQKIYIVEIDNYCYLVPFVRSENRIFLKTIIPSRKSTKEYLRESHE